MRIYFKILKSISNFSLLQQFHSLIQCLSSLKLQFIFFNNFEFFSQKKNFLFSNLNPINIPIQPNLTFTYTLDGLVLVFLVSLFISLIGGGDEGEFEMHSSADTIDADLDRLLKSLKNSFIKRLYFSSIES